MYVKDSFSSRTPWHLFPVVFAKCFLESFIKSLEKLWNPSKNVVDNLAQDIEPTPSSCRGFEQRTASWILQGFSWPIVLLIAQNPMDVSRYWNSHLVVVATSRMVTLNARFPRHSC